ncbi:MAG: zf-HC2 domain-containing protein [Gemmatimonadota bacterium]|nr:zf-HC2 domain-containing protein [Gemmatimonadota bacterium]
MQHPDEGTIHSWLDGALSPDEAARVEAHVAECPQCAAAVAEARGFIAASSRILTALDHVPRGVVPAAALVKHRNLAGWRAAAAVLVVAVGSLVVVRNGARPTRIETTAADTARAQLKAVVPETPGSVEDMRTSSEAVPPVAIIANPSRTAASRSQPSPPAIEKRAVGTNEGTGRGAVSGGAGASGNVAAREQAPVTAPVAAPAAQAYVQSAPISAPTIDAAREPSPLKVVGTPRTVGAKVTLYEVAPGDTVTFTEVLSVQLNAVVPSGIGSAEPLARRSTAKSAAAPPQRTDAAIASAPDSQPAAEAAKAPAARAPVRKVEVANGVTTISWLDVNTGNIVKLSGRLPEARLQQIKLRIERERAAAAAAKKNP